MNYQKHNDPLNCNPRGFLKYAGIINATEDYCQ